MAQTPCGPAPDTAEAAQQHKLPLLTILPLGGCRVQNNQGREAPEVRPRGQIQLFFLAGPGLCSTPPYSPNPKMQHWEAPQPCQQAGLLALTGLATVQEAESKQQKGLVPGDREMGLKRGRVESQLTQPSGWAEASLASSWPMWLGQDCPEQQLLGGGPCHSQFRDFRQEGSRKYGDSWRRKPDSVPGGYQSE